MSLKVIIMVPLQYLTALKGSLWTISYFLYKRNSGLRLLSSQRMTHWSPRKLWNCNYQTSKNLLLLQCWKDGEDFLLFFWDFDLFYTSPGDFPLVGAWPQLGETGQASQDLGRFCRVPRMLLQNLENIFFLKNIFSYHKR